MESIADTIESLPATTRCEVEQLDASTDAAYITGATIATDPPYYDNVGYSDLADYFDVWLRRSIGNVYPDLFSTLLTPKAQELVAIPYRFGGDERRSRAFFEEGLGHVFTNMRRVQNPGFPLTLFYAFKQAEEIESSDKASPRLVASTGWETMLEGLLKAGFSVVGTWPMRTERPTGVKVHVNALASSIVLVCRPRSVEASLATRKEFVRALQTELPHTLDLLIKGAADTSSIAPVDLAQAAIGPGMAIFSRYSQVLEAIGEPMRVRTALELINAEIDRYFSDQEGEQDPPTRFCLAWYRSYGSGENNYGEAETLSKATNVDINALARQGLLTSGAGKVGSK